MSPLDAFWHLSNFFVPAWVVAGLVAALAKLLWRRELKSLAWRRLALWGALGGSGALIAALLVLGHDGKMLGYALMLVGISVPQWLLMIKR
ncbi:MAG: hypothetical protein ABW005_05790 [Burkholderiaceae bacterium]